jgi:uncharacterized repeat protein (TIGR03803 family)
MRIDRRKRLGLLAAAIALPIALASPVQAEAAESNFATIANFDGNDGSAPAALTPFTDGAFYGVAGSGPGVLNDGVVFRFDPASNLLTMLYAFDGTAGAFPQGRVVLGPSGTIFGVTSLYGSAGGGTVFEYHPATQVMKVLHAFTSGRDGGNPAGGLTLGGDGFLYGVTQHGGVFNYGTVFRINPVTGVLTTLHAFNGTDGEAPTGSLSLSPDGNLYGTTSVTLQSDPGTIFRVAPKTGQVTTLLRFPVAALAESGNLAVDKGGNLFDPRGDLVGATRGLILEFVPATRKLSTVKIFDTHNGDYPTGSLLIDPVGNIFGATWGGGQFGNGTLFEIGSAHHLMSVLYSFNTGLPAFQGAPTLSLRFGPGGSLLGTTAEGGYYGYGTIYQFTPRSQ